MRQPTPKPENVVPLILFVRGEKVLLSQHLAALYGVSVSALNQAVKRNKARFPEDFMFQLSAAEFERLKAQTVISSSQVQLKSQAVISKRGGARRALPYAFTEQGVA